MKKILLLTLIFPAFLACSGSSAKEEKQKQEEKFLVSSFRALVKDVPDYFEATGSLVGDIQTDIAPTVPGKVVEVNFDIGSYVTKGSVLIRLDDKDARIRLEQALAQVEQQRRAVQQAEANLEVALSNLAQTKARLGLKPNEDSYNIEDFPQVKVTKAQLELAEKELKRAEKLLESGDISRSIYDQRKSQRDALVAQLADARSNAMVAIQAIETAKAQVRTAQATLAQAEAAVNALEKQVEQAKKSLSDTLVKAPISGYIAEKNVEIGEYVSPNNKIATITRTTFLRIKIDVPEQDVGLVQVGQIVSLQTNSYPDKTFAGRIVRISPSLNPTSRILMAEAEVENSSGLLKPGQFASVRIRKLQPRRAVMIPVSAVRNDGRINRVFVIKNGRVEERIVRLGIIEDNLIEIQQGVQEGEAVAVDRVEQLFDGALVEEE